MSEVEMRIVARPPAQYNLRMTPEEQERYERIERLLEFLANNQAKLSGQQGQFSVHQEQLSADIENLKQITATHTTQIGQLAETMLSLAHIVEEQGRQTDERFRATDERLNALIGVVERYFSNGRKE